MAGDTTSLFRVGDNVELWRLVKMMSVTVAFIVVVERALHALEHHLKKYPKYHDMMNKVYAELMIFGFIGLGIKLVKELGSLNMYSPTMLAFQAADITVFLVAVALIVQSTIVFLRIRRKNIQVDKAELISSQHLVDLMARSQMPTWFHEFAALFTYARPQNKRRITKADIPEVAKLRILRHFFLKSYGLPELFPFSKYLRQAQDNQISHMIEIEISTWIMLLLIGWAMAAVTRVLDDAYPDEELETFSIVVAFVIFSWAAVLLHTLISMYFTWAIDELLIAAVDTHAQSHHVNRYTYLDEIADHEAQTTAHEVASDAIAVMEHVRKQERKKKVKHERSHLTEHDTGFQLISSLFRKVSSKHVDANHEENTAVVREDGVVMEQSPVPVQRQQIRLRWFSRKAWHFLIMTSFMINAFYLALFCQCIIYQVRPIYKKLGPAWCFFLPLPLLLNMFVLQPRILRNFILVSSIFRVDDTALGDVIDHFTQTVQLRAGFVEAVHTYLESTNQTLADLQAEFTSRDVNKTGFLEAEDVRLVLKRFGFKLSYFRFNSVAKLLFDLNGITIEYAQVLRLLELGRSDDVRSLATSTLLSGAPPSSGAAFAFPDSAGLAPYTSSMTPKPRSNKTLVRAKSSAASTLYRFDSTASALGTQEAASPSDLQYLRI